eukprot:UN01719
MQLFASLQIFILVRIVSSQCRWEVGDNVLNLTPLQNELVNTTDDSYHIYLYQICNVLEIETECGDVEDLMVAQYAQSDPTLCYIIGRWDASIMPTYNSDDNSWEFEYANGEACNPSLNRNWSPRFICEEGTRLVYGSVTELFGSCRYLLDIHAEYACPNYTTTTTIPPENRCVWQIGEKTLNLSVVEGFVLNKISDSDPSQIYSVSPCSNNIRCNDHENDAMTTISTISNCIQTIARWDEGVTQPSYLDNFGGQWQFVYVNGDSCNNGPESIVSIFWNCAPFAGTATITSVREVGMCNFEIHIDSNLACSEQ